MLAWKKARPKAVKDQPPDILFHRSGADWEAFIERPDGSRIQVLVEDVDGQPNPDFVPRIAGILEELETLESRARISHVELASRLTSEHRLSLICETHPKADYALGFDCGNETVIVDFQAGEVFSWCFLEEPAEELAPVS